MALKVLRLKRSIDKKKEELSKLREKDAEFETRESELERAIEEAESDEDQAAVDEEIEAFDKEKKEHEDAKEALKSDIEKLEADLAEAEKEPTEERNIVRKDKQKMTNRKFFGMDMQERTAFFANEEVKSFLHEVRRCIKEKRALTNAGLTVPELMLPMIKQVATETSKLMKHVMLRKVPGTGRQNIMGNIPEAFWDDMCAPIKELDALFNGMEVDGFKVSGYFAVCNAILEDSDENLASELIYMIGKAIGKAIDKAILYGRSGKNVRMPLGIVTALITKTAPSGYPSTGREWKDLSATNIISGASGDAGTKLFQKIVTASGVIDNDYDTTALVWCMNKQTQTKILSESIGVNSAAAIVAGMDRSMPVVGGVIETFSFIPDNAVIFGYFKNYVLSERAGTVIDQSEHVRFIEDQTVFRGRARYDGAPAIREAFAIYGIGGAPDTTAPLFAGETAEEETKAKEK